MYSSLTPDVRDSRWTSIRKWLLWGVAVDLLVIVGLIDHVTGRDLSFTLMYLAPISVAIWYIGPVAGLVFCFLAATSGLFIELPTPMPLPAALWNAGVRLGVYVVFYAILNQLRDRQPRGVPIPDSRVLNAFGVAAVCLTLVAAGILQHELPVAASAELAIGRSSHIPGTVQDQWKELASLVKQSMKLSRPLLLGSRDPNGPSCIEISRAGDVKGVLPQNKGDLDGGPGTSMAVLYFYDRQAIKSPLEDFKWHQSRLRTYLENNITLGAASEEAAHTSAERAARFLEAANSWTELPAELSAAGFNLQEDWPNYCLTAIDKAIRERDPAATKYWANELAAATFWLEDLLRWRSFLYHNYLAALDFQARCESLFVGAEQDNPQYKPESSMSQFPAGVLGLNSKGNYYEIERQAERLFSMPADRLIALEENKRVAPNAQWVPPAGRELFLQLRSALSAENQKTWDLAARTPYQHSYLVNLLFRARTAELVDDLTTVLKKFDAHYPHATVNELMGVMMYRGHSFAGNEWGDRFQPQLTEAATKIPTSENDVQALEAAWKWTNQFYQTPAQYGVTFTLRDALAQKKLDCVRATDMIAAIYRNAGRTHLGHVRWCCETGAHSVAAYLGEIEQPGKKVLLADGLVPPHEPEAWPDCYFHGHAWPAGLENNKPPYAMELYVRGLDSYVWLQGYIVRGPNAGWLTTTSIPYSKHFLTGAEQKVFAGPYPE